MLQKDLKVGMYVFIGKVNEDDDYEPVRVGVIHNTAVKPMMIGNFSYNFVVVKNPITEELSPVSIEYLTPMTRNDIMIWKLEN